MYLVKILPLLFFQWCERTEIGHWVQKARWGFAVIETVHIMGIAVLLGSLLIVDIRLLGYDMMRKSAAQLAKQFGIWTWVAFAVMVLTGIPLYLSEAVRLSVSTPFLYKLVFLCLAVLLHITIHKKATEPGVVEGAAFAKSAARLSLACWLAIALAGRAIAFL